MVSARENVMLKKGIAFGLAAMFATTGAQAATVFGVDEFNNLVTFNSAAPGVVTRSIAITGLTESLQAIDFRPRNNVLYGLGSDRVVYTIDTATGAATAASGVLGLAGSQFAFDFNPTIDRLRIVSNTNANYVFNPNDGSLATTTPVFYASGDTNAGREPDVTAAAYTSAAFGAAANATQLYSIDISLDQLTRQANSAGTLNTVGPVGLNLGSRTSFDIAGSDAFVQNGTGFYSINLNNGALTRIGTLDRSLFGIAIAAVPEPASWAMMIAGVGMVGGTMRRRKPSMRLRHA